MVPAPEIAACRLCCPLHDKLRVQCVSLATSVKLTLLHAATKPPWQIVYIKMDVFRARTSTRNSALAPAAAFARACLCSTGGQSSRLSWTEQESRPDCLAPFKCAHGCRVVGTWVKMTNHGHFSRPALGAHWRSSQSLVCALSDANKSVGCLLEQQPHAGAGMRACP